MRGDDLTGIFTVPQLEGARVRQATVVAFDQETGANTINLAGADIANVPFLSSAESVELAPGDVVLLITQGRAWFILGRVVTPGSANLAPSALDVQATGFSETNFSLTTAFVEKASSAFFAPDWANRATVTVMCDASVENTTAANDIVYIRAVINGTGGGTNYAPVGTSATYPDRYANLAASRVREFNVVGGQTVPVGVEMRTSVAGWPADADNIINFNATAIFRRI